MCECVCVCVSVCRFMVTKFLSAHGSYLNSDGLARCFGLMVLMYANVVISSYEFRVPQLLSVYGSSVNSDAFACGGRETLLWTVSRVAVS